MREKHRDEYRTKSQEWLEKEIPNYKWLQTLNVGDKAILMIDVGWQRGYKPVTIKNIVDGIVETNEIKWGKFEFGSIPTEMGVYTIIPLTEENMKELEEHPWYDPKKYIFITAGESHYI